MNRPSFDSRFWLRHDLLPLLVFALLVRGTHFASRNLWSTAIAGNISLFLYVCLFRGRLFPETGAEQKGDLPR